MEKLLLKWGVRLGLAMGLAPSAAWAICDVEYATKPGDNLFAIAEAHYGDREFWSLIYFRNQRLLAASSVIPGRTLFIPCPREEEIVADATPLRQEKAELTLLTGGDFAPFTDESLPGQGMVTELVNAALELAPSPVSYAINWESDWSQHLFPMLDEKKFDMGFPWVKPDCELNPGHDRCVNFHFSDPLMVLPVMLFVAADRPFEFNSDADLHGKTICRPDEYFSHDQDTGAREWLDLDKVEVVQPHLPHECFVMLTNGSVDAVAMNLFLGADLMVRENLRDKVMPLDRPVAQIGLHVAISKRHWRGTSHLYRINAGLKKLQASGRFEEIMTRHLELFWARLS